MYFHIITIFPNIFDSYLNESILGRALDKKIIKIYFYNPRDFVKDKKGNGFKPIDDKPYGGGPGMVMKAEPILKSVNNALVKIKRRKNTKVLIINFVPSAEKFNTKEAKNISRKYTDVVLICGRYEGVDARVDKILKSKKFSVGDYVLTGGEIPAMVLVDCISRQVKGVLGKYESLEEERVSSSEVYTRPEVLIYPKINGKKYKVPEVLLSGNHKEIEGWKNKNHF